MLNIRQNYPLSASDFGLVPKGPFFFFFFFFSLSLLLQPVPRRDGRVGLEHGRSLQKRAKSQRPGFPLPDGKQNGHAAAILFAAGWEGEGKGGETQARREHTGRMGGEREGEGRVSIRQEPKSSAAMPGRVLPSSRWG